MGEHGDRIEKLLKEGRRDEAKVGHVEHLNERFAAADCGEVIDLTDLIGASELFIDTKGKR